jgi:hypothetical protein
MVLRELLQLSLWDLLGDMLILLGGMLISRYCDCSVLMFILFLSDGFE